MKSQRPLLPGVIASLFVWAGCPSSPPSDAGVNDAGKSGVDDAGSSPDAGNPNPCPTPAAPVCDEGQEVSSSTDDNGCLTLECVDVSSDGGPITEPCPTVAEPQCAEGQVIEPGLDAQGCPTAACVDAPSDAGVQMGDAGPTASTATIQMLLDDAANGIEDVNYLLEDVYVTYVRTIGYTIQASADGPAIFVYSGSVPAGLRVGNKITLEVRGLGFYRSLLQINDSSILSNDEGNYDVIANLALDLGEGDGTPLTTDAVARLVQVTEARVLSGTGRNWTLQYGTTGVEAAMYAYDASAVGLCAGAKVDIVSGYIGSFDDNLAVDVYYTTDFANLDTTGCASPDAGTEDDAGAQEDAGLADDAGSETDAGSADDAGATDDAGSVDAGPVAGAFVINEVDYDQPSTDTAEFIELYNGSDAAIDLTGYQLLFVNGANNTTYSTVDLSTAGTLPVGQYLVVKSSTVSVPASALVVSFTAADPNIQNGNPDAIALVSATEVIDALVYGGSVSADLGMPYGVFNFGDGSALVDVTTGSTNGSLARKVDGIDTDDYAADWTFTTTLTPGAANQID